MIVFNNFGFSENQFVPEHRLHSTCLVSAALGLLFTPNVANATFLAPEPRPERPILRQLPRIAWDIRASAHDKITA